MNELTRQIAQVESGALVAALDGVDVDEHHHQHCHDQRRDHTAHKQLGHTDRGRRAVYDQRDRGREDGADDRGGSSNGSGEIIVVAVVTHGLDLDSAQTASVGRSRAGHAGKDDRGQHVGVTQTTGNPAHQLAGGAEQLVGDLTGVHQVARQNEQRNSDEQPAVNTGNHLLTDDHQRVAQRQAAQHGREADGHRDGNANDQKCNKCKQEEDHAAFPPFLAAMWPTSISKLFSAMNTPAIAIGMYWIV